MGENTIKSIDELLQMFVSIDEHRVKFMKPWRERNQVFATETHILIRVNGYLTTADYPQYNSDNTNKLFPTGTPNGILTALTLENAISYAPLIDEMIIHGVDIRIMNEEQAYWLNKLRLRRSIHIAWDLPT